MMDCLAVGAGGFMGAVLRYLIGLAPLESVSGFPYKTFAINLIGALMIGLIVGLAARHSSLSPRLVLFLKVGICGGFTTFSSFALETSDLLRAGSAPTAAFYAMLSMGLGVAAVLAGQQIAA
ncbi:fluoride efflux transporter CrcB [Pseudoramibacter faecis]|uniref:fluoride efflux transporter CrcB n=1 Tax=Pseudoramibacter faecis TaxID=3108534 RepID=UPI002E771A77|nr:fluoride efflux transporter CrcB [Pseudoramibacter sp. HA2172]